MALRAAKPKDSKRKTQLVGETPPSPAEGRNARSEPFELWIEYPNGGLDTLLVSIARREDGNVADPDLAPNIYRIEETPPFGFGGLGGLGELDFELDFGDTIETEPQADGTHRFVRVVKRAELRHYSWILPRQFVDTRQCSEYVAAVVAAGGIWERIMGGLLLVHIPLGSEFDAEAELGRHIFAAAKDAPGALHQDRS